MRRIGLVSVAALAICLGAVVVAMAGRAGGSVHRLGCSARPRGRAAQRRYDPGPGSRRDEPAAIQPAAGARIVALAVRGLRAPSVWQCHAPAHHL